MAFVSASSGSTGSGESFEVSVPAPSGIVAGYQLLACIISGPNNSTFSAPAGWSPLGTRKALLFGGNVVATTVFQKIATASEPSSYIFSEGGGAKEITAIVACFSGVVVDTSTFAFNASASSLAAQSITTTQANEEICIFWTSGLGGSTGITVPGGVTSLATATDFLGSYAEAIALGGYTGPSTPGSSSPGTATGMTGAWYAMTISLKTPTPMAPTLTEPVNASYIDLAALGGPFQWTYNTGGEPPETGYHYRMKASGGSYNYWNAATPGFQSTDVANTSTSTTVTFPGSSFTDGVTYNWSTASIDAGGTGPYASDNVVNAQVAPSVTVAAPTGTYSTNQTPTVSWSDSLASGGTQSSYRVVTYSAAQYGAVGFTPGSGPSLDDSGVQVSASTSYTVVNPIPTGTTVRSYVQITQNPGGQTSAWAFTSYTVSLDVPATPNVSAVAGNDPTTGYPYIAVTVQAEDNFLTANQASLLNGNTTGWTAGSGTTLSAVTSPAPPPGVSSAYVLKLAGSGLISASTPTGLSGVPCLPNTPYTALASFQSASTGRTCQVAMSFYDATGTFIISDGQTVADNSSGWTAVAVTATSPSNAAFVAIPVQAAAAAENHFVTEIGFFPGTVAAWSQGGFVGSTTITILRSDGLYVREASTADPMSIPTPSQSVTVGDYEATPTTNYTYTAIVSIVTGGTAGTLASSPGTSASVAVPGGQGFWEIDPTNTPSAVNCNPTVWNPSQLEQSAAHTVLNQTTTNVVAAGMQAPDITATFEVFTPQGYQGLIALATSQKTIFVSDPFGLSYYFRLALAPGGMSTGNGSTAHSTQTQPSSAAGPHRVVAITGVAQPRPMV